MSAAQTRVDFYLLSGNNLHQLHLFCCRLAEKAWKLGNRVWIRTGDSNETRVLDDLLWSFSDGSFVPHASDSDAAVTQSPVVIGQHPPPEMSGLLINLAADIPAEAAQYSRIAEILNDDPQLKQRGRARYAQYDKSNYTLEHHTINQ